MQWSDIRNAYPNEWLIIEALQAHTSSTYQRLLDKIAVVERCVDGTAAMQAYRRLHQLYPFREFYFVHTSREQLDIHERQWLGIRREHAVVVEG
ncbi:MAG: hypothetical protein HUU23_17225 [Caldilineales bacterium]|nr:hypothetical protein [Caldilineales bacterium]